MALAGAGQNLMLEEFPGIHNPAFVSVHRLTHGESVESQRLFIPLDRHVLLGDRVPNFDVYCSNEDKRGLELIIISGEGIPSTLVEWISDSTFQKILYARGDQRDLLLAFEQARLDEILDDKTTPLESKCGILRDVTSMLSMMVFETPTARAIQRQRAHITRMIDFSMATPGAVRHLLRLTHHDYYTYTHCVNVGIYGLAIAIDLLGKDKAHDLQEIAVGCFLHDLGKCRIKEEIINKKGPLTPEEWEVMRRHPDFGYEILKAEDNLSREVSSIIQQHHERIDGTGYPRGLHGKSIHIYARICAVADAFDALTTKRAYKNPVTSFTALNIMKKEMCDHFDPEVFRVFVLMLKGEEK